MKPVWVQEQVRGAHHSCPEDEYWAESFKLLKDLGLEVTDQLFSIFPRKERLEGGRTEVGVWERQKPLKRRPG